VSLVVRGSGAPGRALARLERAAAGVRVLGWGAALVDLTADATAALAAGPAEEGERLLAAALARLAGTAATAPAARPRPVGPPRRPARTAAPPASPPRPAAPARTPVPPATLPGAAPAPAPSGSAPPRRAPAPDELRRVLGRFAPPDAPARAIPDAPAAIRGGGAAPRTDPVGLCAFGARVPGGPAAARAALRVERGAAAIERAAPSLPVPSSASADADADADAAPALRPPASLSPPAPPFAPAPASATRAPAGVTVPASAASEGASRGAGAPRRGLAQLVDLWRGGTPAEAAPAAPAAAARPPAPGTADLSAELDRLLQAEARRYGLEIEEP
jgi:hypothetical protein